MIFTQYYPDCLSQASYLIGDWPARTSGRTSNSIASSTIEVANDRHHGS